MNNALALPVYTRALVKKVPPEQWLYPGPNSRHVLASNVSPVDIPDYTISPQTFIVMQYQVPDGMIFSLRGVSVLFFGQGWNQGSGDLSFTLEVISSGGPRDVDFLQNIITELGSTEFPHPIGGRLEFEPLETLQWNATVTANVAIGPPNYVVCKLWGHLYPSAERREGD